METRNSRINRELRDYGMVVLRSLIEGELTGDCIEFGSLIFFANSNEMDFPAMKVHIEERRAGLIEEVIEIDKCGKSGDLQGHHYVLESPNGPESIGQCKFCGKRMVGRNSLGTAETSGWQSNRRRQCRVRAGQDLDV